MTKIPPDLRARGWRIWMHYGEAHAVRVDGRADAPFSASAHRNSGCWCAYLERPPRRLCDPAPSLVEALIRFEEAERQGLFSPLWDNAPGLPRRRGWAHRVVARQDQWITVAKDIPLPLTVLTLPVNAYSGGLRFVAFAGDEPITRSREIGELGLDSDTLTLFDEAREAMAWAERAACKRARSLGYSEQLSFVAPIPNKPVRELSNV